MFEKKVRMYINVDERSILTQALIDMKNDLHCQGRYTDAVDELIIKILEPKRKRVKTI